MFIMTAEGRSLPQEMSLNLKEKLSPHFTLGEMLRSGTARAYDIDNLPPFNSHGSDSSRRVVFANLRALCQHVLEPLRRRVGRIIVVSGYRCATLNRLVGGAKCSQHLRGEAADLHVTGNAMARKYLNVLRQTDFDQIILEPRNSAVKRWLHVSYKRNGNNRNQIIGVAQTHL